MRLTSNKYKIQQLKIYFTFQGNNDTYHLVTIEMTFIKLLRTSSKYEHLETMSVQDCKDNINKR
jgi:hypothetical protein